MMHGYLAFDAAGELLVPFRTWRNTSTGPAAERLSEALGVQHPAALVDRAPVPGGPRRRAARRRDRRRHHPRRATCTDASPGGTSSASGTRRGMFPIDPATRDYDAAMLETRPTPCSPPRRTCSACRTCRALLPEVLVAGAGRRRRSPPRAPPGSTRPARSSPASRSARPRATPAPAWSRRTPSPRAPATSASARASSRWSCSSSPLTHRARGTRRRHHARPATPWRWCTATTARARSPAGPGCSDASPRPQRHRPTPIGSTTSTRPSSPRPRRRADPDAGGLLSFNYLAGEPVTHVEDGRPLLRPHPRQHASRSATWCAPRCTARSRPWPSAWTSCTANRCRSTG